YRAWVNGLVDVKGDGRNLKRGVLFFPGPNQLRVEVRIVIEFLAGLYARDRLNVVVNLVSGERRVSFRRDQTNRRIVDALLATVFVPVNRPLLRVCISAVFPFSSRHPALPLCNRTGL